jgi:hypothetical protein
MRMQIHFSANAARPLMRAGLIPFGSFLVVPAVHAEGCMPIRYPSPSLSAKDDAHLNHRQWQFGIAYRWPHADRFYATQAGRQ